jgi:hypothetical protein
MHAAEAGLTLTALENLRNSRVDQARVSV